MSLQESALSMCQIALGSIQEQQGKPLTREQIRSSAAEVSAMPMFIESVDVEKLVGALEELYTIWSEDPSAIGLDDDHVPWLAQTRGDIEWRFWERYRLFMQRRQGLSPAAVANVSKVTDEILGRLERPQRPDSWDRRGLVMGNVQSGKTATYTGLICKAADAGYKVIVVLAGMHNNLRSQTQVRLDEGFLGYRAAPPSDAGDMFERTGVAEFGHNARADSVTNRNENGDFNRQIARHFGIHPGGNPLLFVTKKNVTVLKNLLGWIRARADREEPSTGRKFHRDIPLLVIDDEADQASVDTKVIELDENGEPNEEHDPTKINGLIRSLLHAFDKSAYVGFTATPFANIFIHEQARTRQLGDDLFPRSFIVNLPAPSNYIGAARIFGITEDEDAGLKELSPLPIVRFVSDHADSDEPDETAGWMPPKLELKTAHVPLWNGARTVPPSLHKALLSFLLATAVRTLREGTPLFNSMLVHVVRFTAVQSIVKEEIEKDLEDIEARLKYGDGGRAPTILDDLESIWRTDFVVTTQSIGAPYVLPSWGDVAEILPRIAASIDVRVINGSALDALDYEQHRSSGLNIVAVGGDKLSRGLTLEGLTVSYFLRSSKMYDTLMQMGRWFGYKEAYLDVCRLYTTSDLYEWFQHIAAASEELRLEFDHMVAVGGTPRDYGLKVRSHPTMLVTSAVKMRTGTTLRLSYAGDISETIIFDTNRSIKGNADAARALIGRLGSPIGGGASGGYHWNCDAEPVLEFLAEYRTHPEARRADTALLAKYIRTQLRQGELTRWTVLLASSGLAEAPAYAEHFNGFEIGGVRRAYFGEYVEGKYRVRRLVNPSDEQVDLGATELEEALRRTLQAWEESTRKDKSPEPPRAPSGQSIRAVRPKQQAVLIIYPLDSRLADQEGTLKGPIVGFAISFPASDTAKAIEYRANNVFAASGAADYV